MISRDGQLIPPRGSTQVTGGDHVFVVIRPENRERVDEVFTRAAVPRPPGDR
jgi:cell volume regulation protein A